MPVAYSSPSGGSTALAAAPPLPLPSINDGEALLVYSLSPPSPSISATAPSPTPQEPDLSISPVSPVSYAAGHIDHTLSGPPAQEGQQQDQQEHALQPNALHEMSFQTQGLHTSIPVVLEYLDSFHETYAPLQLMTASGSNGPAPTFVYGPPAVGGAVATGTPHVVSGLAPAAAGAPPAPPAPPHSQIPDPVAPPAPTMAMAIPVNTPINMYGLGAVPNFTTPFEATNPFVSHYASINLSPPNENLTQFLKNWARETARDRHAASLPFDEGAINSQINLPACVIRASDVDGDHCDMQGVNWAAMGTTLAEARHRRQCNYRNFTSITDSDCWFPQRYERSMPASKEHYFDFQQTHIRKSIRVPHFQLRNLLATASRSRAYFPGNRNGTVTHYNMLTGETSLALRFPSSSDVQISTLAADHGVLVAGGFGGEYCITNIDAEYVDQELSEVKCAGSVTSRLESGISNHIQVHRMRNVSGPVASFSSNDQALRILDITTNKIIYDVRFTMPLNCSAISPDGRLRVVMGDTMAAFIVPATPERHTATSADGVHHKPDILQSLWGHQDYGFSCAWADDGYTLATGSQDRAIKIWDARRWCSTSGQPEPVVTLRTQMAGARSLHFSPVGSGKRLLIAAEESDIISVIDAQTFASRQSIEIFGEIAGVSQTAEGQNLVALCADSSRGGLMQFERSTAWQAGAAAWHDEGPCHHHGRGDARWPNINTFDWKWCGIGHGTDVSAAAHVRRLRVSAKRIRAAAAARSYSAYAPPPLNDVFDGY